MSTSMWSIILREVHPQSPTGRSEAAVDCFNWDFAGFQGPWAVGSLSLLVGGRRCAGTAFPLGCPVLCAPPRLRKHSGMVILTNPGVAENRQLPEPEVGGLWWTGIRGCLCYDLSTAGGQMRRRRAQGRRSLGAGRARIPFWALPGVGPQRAWQTEHKQVSKTLTCYECEIVQRKSQSTSETMRLFWKVSECLKYSKKIYKNRIGK